MRQRVVEIALPMELAGALAEAVTAYAHAAFPMGGSECAQVSREALLDTAGLCQAHQGGPLTLRKRQLAQLRAAVDWYFSEQAPTDSGAGDALRQVLSR
jgi:hypothetical protein